MGRGGSLVLGDNLSGDGVTIKTLVVVHQKIQPLQCRMNQESFQYNDVNGIGTDNESPSSGRCPVEQQRRLGLI